jgi:hypothetical protein
MNPNILSSRKQVALLRINGRRNETSVTIIYFEFEDESTKNVLPSIEPLHLLPHTVFWYLVSAARDSLFGLRADGGRGLREEGQREVWEQVRLGSSGVA